jgi:sugar O-acyltransferase (sialic acid O-acetyltransferase NeuD family)
MTTLYLCGAGNPEGVRLALNINNAQNRWDRIVILDDDPSRHGQSILDVEIAGPFAVLEQADPDSDEVSNMVARTTRGRQSARRKIQAFGLPFAPLIDPGVDMMGVDAGRDITVYRNAQCLANAIVDEGTVALMGAIVGHACRVGRCCVVAPGAVINARVELGDGVYVGTNASIMPDLKIGPWATIGANSAVVQDVPAGATVMGVPAQLIVPGGIHYSDVSAADSVARRPDFERSDVTAKPQPERMGNRSDALRKLRIAQEKFIADHKPTKT